MYRLIKFNKISFVSTAERIKCGYTFYFLWNSIPIGREAVRGQQFAVFRVGVWWIIPEWIIRIFTKKFDNFHINFPVAYLIC